MADHVTVTHLIHGTVVVEDITGHRVLADISRRRRGTVRVYGRNGKIKRVVGYARIERFEWRTKRGSNKPG